MTIDWAAGLFEGEGHIPRHDTRRGYSLSLGMTDFDVVKEFEKTIGCGKIRECEQPKSHHKNMYRWSVTDKANVRTVLEKLVPFFGLRRGYVALNYLDIIDKV